MEVLATYPLEKYQTDAYEPVLFDIYRKKDGDCFVFTCELKEEAEQYPLEDLLEEYWLVCGEYRGEKVELNGQERYLLEVETLSAKKEDLRYILNFSTIVGKKVVNFSIGKYVSMGLDHDEETYFFLNNQEIKVPIYRDRFDSNGMLSFDNTSAEAVLIYQQLQKGVSYDYARVLGMNFDLLYVKGWTAYLVGQKNGVDYRLIIGTKGPLGIEILTKKRRDHEKENPSG